DVIVGSEITSHEGDILALFIEEDIPYGLSAVETVAQIHAQGGLAIAAHPYTFAFSLIGINGMRGVKGLIGQVAFDGVEERNGTPTEFFSNLWTRRRNRGIQHHPATGGSDTHYLPTLGSAYTLFEGETAQELRRALEAGTVRPGGHIYSPFRIFNVIIDRISKRLPVRTLNAEHAEAWTRV
ncbi:MAG: PHP-associated domain-containing protein, partial [Chloroflexota bacterium]